MMGSLAVGLITIIVGAVLLNLAGAGLVAGLYFWRGVRSANRRALQGALLTGVIFSLMLSGAFIQGIVTGDFTAPIMLVSVLFTLALGTGTAMPGAFIMSRKIAKTDVLGDTFE